MRNTLIRAAAAYVRGSRHAIAVGGWFLAAQLGALEDDELDAR